MEGIHKGRGSTRSRRIFPKFRIFPRVISRKEGCPYTGFFWLSGEEVAIGAEYTVRELGNQNQHVLEFRSSLYCQSIRLHNPLLIFTKGHQIS